MSLGGWCAEEGPLMGSYASGGLLTNPRPTRLRQSNPRRPGAGCRKQSSLGTNAALGIAVEATLEVGIGQLRIRNREVHVVSVGSLRRARVGVDTRGENLI